MQACCLMATEFYTCTEVMCRAKSRVYAIQKVAVCWEEGKLLYCGATAHTSTPLFVSYLIYLAEKCHDYSLWQLANSSSSPLSRQAYLNSGCPLATTKCEAHPLVVKECMHQMGTYISRCMWNWMRALPADKGSRMLSNGKSRIFGGGPCKASPLLKWATTDS